MAATPTGVRLSTTKITASTPNTPKQQAFIPLHRRLTWKSTNSLRLSASFRAAAGGGPSTPANISEKVLESIKEAEQVCAEDATSGECVAAWDEVEELSAAASHARDKLKASSDPLEVYCKDNPETEECRTYED